MHIAIYSPVGRCVAGEITSSIKRFLHAATGHDDHSFQEGIAPSALARLSCDVYVYLMGSVISSLSDVDRRETLILTELIQLIPCKIQTLFTVWDQPAQALFWRVLSESEVDVLDMISGENFVCRDERHDWIPPLRPEAQAVETPDGPLARRLRQWERCLVTGCSRHLSPGERPCVIT